jgi:hypothetical protein
MTEHEKAEREEVCFELPGTYDTPEEALAELRRLVAAMVAAGREIEEEGPGDKIGDGAWLVRFKPPRS